LRYGAVERYGDVFDVTQAYLAYHERKSAPLPEREEIARAGHEFSVCGVALNGLEGDAPLMLEMGDALRVDVRVRSRDGRVPCIAVGVVRADGTAVYGVTSDMDGVVPNAVGADEFRCEIEFPELSLLPGSYAVRVHPLDSEGVRLFDTVERSIVVRGASREFGLVRLPHRWRDGEADR
jgi:lipopolysaccharide transport system ATP-binding protein